MSRRRIFKQDAVTEHGFGSRVVEKNQRLMNKDGSSNVKRKSNVLFLPQNYFHHLITMSWWKFSLVVFAGFTITNLIFACLYYFGDVDHINGMVYKTEAEKFMQVFFLSAQSLTTVGYGRLNPEGMYNETVAAIESMFGLLGFALATGLLYGRFSRPVANLAYSKNAILAPFNGMTAIMMRVANKNKSELVDCNASMIVSYTEEVNGVTKREFDTLKLEYTHITVLSISWTIVHPIDEESPLYGWAEEDFQKKEVEFLLLFQAYEETFAQTVHSRSSYRWHEIVFGAKFNRMVVPAEDGSVTVELDRINDHSPAPLFEEI